MRYEFEVDGIAIGWRKISWWVYFLKMFFKLQRKVIINVNGERMVGVEKRS